MTGSPRTTPTRNRPERVWLRGSGPHPSLLGSEKVTFSVAWAFWQTLKSRGPFSAYSTTQNLKCAEFQKKPTAQNRFVQYLK